MILAIYMIVMICSPFACDLFLKNMEEGEMFHFWNKYILFPLKERNSKWAMPLGACDTCFTIWVGTIFGTSITAYWLYHIGSWFVWIVPTYFFLNLFISISLYKIHNKIFDNK